MKKIFFIFLILLISNNIFVFLCGIFMQTKYYEHFNKMQGAYLLDSALVLAIHDFEDNNQPEINKEIIFNKKKIGYSINKIDDEKIYIKVYYKQKDKIIYREYLKNI
jgi:hypothetical protein